MKRSNSVKFICMREGTGLEEGKRQEGTATVVEEGIAIAGEGRILVGELLGLERDSLEAFGSREAVEVLLGSLVQLDSRLEVVGEGRLVEEDIATAVGGIAAIDSLEEGTAAIGDRPGLRDMLGVASVVDKELGKLLQPSLVAASLEQGSHLVPFGS